MPTLPLHFDELVELLRACVTLPPDHCTPTDLRDHLAARLARSAPALTSRVQAFNERQMQSLCQIVRQAFELSGENRVWAAADGSNGKH
jgi:hypothetical protein